jgi:hypothetical protein
MSLRSMIKRLFGRRSVAEILAEAAEEETPEDEISKLNKSVTRLTKAVDEQKRAVALAERTLTARRERVEASHGKAEQAEADLGALVGARDSLADWLQERSNSMALRILTHLDDETRRLKADEEALTAIAEAAPPDLSDYAERLRRSYVIGVWISLGIALVVPPIVTSWFNTARDLQGDDRIGSSWWHYLVAAVVTFFVVLLFFLARYHRGYVGMARVLGEHLDKCEYIIESIDVLRAERARLAAISTQMQERLAFLGAVLQQPWDLPEEDEASTFDDDLARGFPSLMQVATASASDDATRNALRREFIARGFTADMRSEAYRRALQLAARQEGLGEEPGDLAWVDKDPTMHGLRSSLLMRARSPEVLQQVGQEKLETIIAEIRRGFDRPADDDEADSATTAISRVRPPVVRRNIDPLKGLELTSDGPRLAETQRWDDFVAEILEAGSSLSPLAFTGAGRRADEQRAFTSRAAIPERMRMLWASKIEVAGTGPAPGRGTEVTTRLDVTDSMDPAHVGMFEFEPTQDRAGTDHSRAPLAGSL